MGARNILGWWRNRSRATVSGVVLSEIPQTILPPGSGSVVATGPAGPLSVPKGWETVIIAGQERVRVPEIYRGPSPVLEPIDPDILRTPVPVPVDDSEFEEENVAHDWGHLGRQFLGGLMGNGDGGGGQVYTPAYTSNFPVTTTPAPLRSTAAGCEPCGPRYLTYDCKTGKFSSRKRRRRRRLATPSDLADLAAIVAITGKGSAMNQAVAGLVRR